MHELFELPKNSINGDKEDRVLNRYKRPNKDTKDLEEEMKTDNRMTEGNSEDDEITPEL